MPVNRREFVGLAGVAVPGIAALPSEMQSTAALTVRTGDDQDVTTPINVALANNSDVFLPAGTYRIDGTVLVPRHTRLTLAHGAILQRFRKHTDNQDAVISVLGNRAYLAGGRIITENDHPHGIVKLGHADATKDTRYNATQWYFGDCWIEGRQSPSNVAIWIPNAQAIHKSIAYANYFGFVQNVAIRRADIGVLLDEVANGHRFYGVFFSHLISAAWDLRGAYGNQIFGGFLHQSRDGIVAIRLRNTSNDRYHDSIHNSFFGFGIEPGGKKSSAYHIESRCRRNTLILQSNVGSTSVDENGDNFVSRHGGDWPVRA